MIDITQNTTPHGLLREIDPEAAAALESWRHGVEYWSNNYKEWKKTNPRWVDADVYRAIPAPVRVVRWVNMTRSDTGCIYKTRAEADRVGSKDRIAVLRVEHDERTRRGRRQRHR